MTIPSTARLKHQILGTTAIVKISTVIRQHLLHTPTNEDTTPWSNGDISNEERQKKEKKGEVNMSS
jgi:hypothetical protein